VSARRPLYPRKRTFSGVSRMSALCGGLKRSTQHFISGVRDGVDGQWLKICSRFQCGGQGELWNRWRFAFASTEWLSNSMNGRPRLWASKPGPNEI
jgi:hypothetical protein